MRWCCKKYALIKIWQSANKAVSLDYDNKNNPILPQLPKHKDKEKWQEIVQKTKLFVQNLFSSIYRRPRINVQRLPFLLDTEDFNNVSSRHWNQKYICNREGKHKEGIVCFA